jgi:hypothetical protein
MKLSDIFDQLTFGELKQVGMGGFEEGAIQPENYREVVNHLNLALVNLYTRFPIKEKQLILKTKEGQTKYPLLKQYAYSVDPVNYTIVDTLDAPFLEDILRIDAAFDVYGMEYFINDNHAANSLFTTSYDEVTVPWATGDELISIAYRAKPTKIVVPAAAATLNLSQAVHIPDTLLEPVLVYIEYRVMKSRGGDAGLAQAGMAKAHYDTLCTEIEERNILRNANNTTNIKPELNNWI